MNWLDITTYLNMNLGNSFFDIFCVLFLLAIPYFMRLAYINDTYSGSKEEEKYCKTNNFFLRKLLPFVTVIGIILGMMPTHSRILSLKIEKIKNEAVNKENISKGVETLERIGKKLECKYLGCEGKND